MGGKPDKRIHARDDAKRQRRTDPSMKCGCLAKYRISQQEGKSFVVSFDFNHTGHDVYSIKSFQESRIPAQASAQLNEAISMGLNWTAMKSVLRFDKGAVDDVSESTSKFASLPVDIQLLKCTRSSLPLAIRIERKDFYNRYRKRFLDAFQKAPDGFESLEMWAKELIKESWNVLLLKTAPSCGLTDCLVFGMISPWQRKVRKSSISLGSNALIFFSFPIGPGAIRKRRVDGQHPPYLLLSKRQERQNLPNHLDRQKQSDW
jgi:hypothetical protein